MRVYDTFVFDSELALLDYRLSEVYDLVEQFVLVEASETFQGQPKPLFFRQESARFEWAKPKLRHIVLPYLPGNTTWERESFQRNAIQLGLYDARPDDIVLILDADEIPSRSMLQTIRSGGLSRPHRLLMTRHYGRLETLAPRSACCASQNDVFPFAIPHLLPGSWDALDPTWWCMPGVAVRFRDITGDKEKVVPARTPHILRRETQFGLRLANAGRHLSSIANAEQLRIKLSHFSHSEHADERSIAAEHLVRTLNFAIHARGWWYAEEPRGQLPDDLVRLLPFAGSLEPTPKSGNIRRMLVRTWAWIRHSPNTPKRLVSFVDRNFDRVLPFLMPLLIVEFVCGRIAWWQMRKSTVQPTAH